ncbi:MAG TPA: response regulator [Nitrospirae bacterium]|nr:response regulator [Nitrospirota bacterium]HDK17595.1 response regulator [Nitrospirota bacterium]HDO25322.1 response regulator [Nitrospirota bacterium]HDZ83672.1 response regulator [Nitrospirota bacterium]
MPKMNGQKVHNEIQKIKPAIKTIFISGYTANVMHKKKILAEGINFIPKPVLSYDLLIKVRECWINKVCKNYFLALPFDPFSLNLISLTVLPGLFVFGEISSKTEWPQPFSPLLRGHTYHT